MLYGKHSNFIPLNNKMHRCGETVCEETIYEESRGEKEEVTEEETKEEDKGKTKATGSVKSLCMPMNGPEVPENAVCVKCGKPAKHWVLWGRSY